MVRLNSVHGEFCSSHLHGVRLGLFANVWMDSAQDDVNDISDVLLKSKHKLGLSYLVLG